MPIVEFYTISSFGGCAEHITSSPALAVTITSTHRSYPHWMSRLSWPGWLDWWHISKGSHSSILLVTVVSVDLISSSVNVQPARELIWVKNAKEQLLALWTNDRLLRVMWVQFWNEDAQYDLAYSRDARWKEKPQFHSRGMQSIGCPPSCRDCCYRANTFSMYLFSEYVHHQDMHRQGVHRQGVKQSVRWR